MRDFGIIETVHAQSAAGQDLRPQTATILQKLLRTRPERTIHPVTRFAVRRAAKFYSLNFKFGADERIQIRAFRYDIAPRGSRRFFRKIQHCTHRVENFQRKERDLSFVIFLKIKKPVPFDTTSGNALHLHDFDDCVIAGGLSVTAKKVVPG